MNIAIVLAGGVGSRMGANVPKQFLKVGTKPVLAYTLEKFQNNANIDGIVVVCKAEWVEEADKICRKYNISKLICVVPGGEERRDSSYIGVKTAKEYVEKNGFEKSGFEKNAGNTIVLIHDAARPFVTDGIIDENISCAKKYGACETAVAISDTVVRAQSGMISTTDAIVPRDNLYRVQTPQSFRLDVILSAHENVPQDIKVTDDAMLVLAEGGKVQIVEGSPMNIKITTKADLDFFKVAKNDSI